MNENKKLSNQIPWKFITNVASWKNSVCAYLCHEWPSLIIFPIKISVFLDIGLNHKHHSSRSLLKLNNMINSRVKKAASDTSSSNNAPITIQVQVPGANDGSISNNHLVPQQDCPSFSGDCVLDGAFKKISNTVKQK